MHLGDLHVSLQGKRDIHMSAPQILIAAIIIVFVIAFVVTMLYVNAQTSKIIDANVKLEESQNTLLSQNMVQTDLLEKLEECGTSAIRASASAVVDRKRF